MNPLKKSTLEPFIIIFSIICSKDYFVFSWHAYKIVMMQVSRRSVSVRVPMTTLSLPLPLSGLNLDSFSALPFVKGDVTRSRSQSAAFSKARSSGGWAGRELCGGFWLNVCPSACPSEEGQILTFTMQFREKSLNARDGARLRVRGKGKWMSGDWLKPVLWIFMNSFPAFCITRCLWLAAVSNVGLIGITYTGVCWDI